MQSIAEDEVRRRLDPAALIAALEAAFRDRFPHCRLPARTHIPTLAGVALVMPCYDASRNALGLKLVAVSEKPARPGDLVLATYLLLDPSTGQPTLQIAANYLTDVRTAATSALATKLLARGDSHTLGLFGCGRQARAHARVLPLVRRFQRILVCGLDQSEANSFAREVSAELHLPVEPSDASAVAAESDVLCTCTTAHEPFFDGRLLRPGTHLNLIGAFQPHTREVDSVCIQRARLYVDTYDAALAEAGEILIPLREGRIGRDHVIADLHELVSGKKPARRNPEEITIFKSVGCALEDLVAAELLLQ